MRVTGVMLGYVILCSYGSITRIIADAVIRYGRGTLCVLLGIFGFYWGYYG